MEASKRLQRVSVEEKPGLPQRLGCCEEEVIEKVDSRYKPPKPYKAVECEALKQKVFVRLVRKWLDAHLPEPLDDVLAREQEQRDDIAAKLLDIEG